MSAAPPAPKRDNNNKRRNEKSVIKIFETKTKLLGYVKSNISNESKLFPIVNKLEAFKKELSWFGIILSTLQFSLLIYFLVHHAAINKQQNKLDLGIRITMIALSIPLAILGMLGSFGILTTIAPILTLVSVTKGFCEKIWETGLALYERFNTKGQADQAKIMEYRKNLSDIPDDMEIPDNDDDENKAAPIVDIDSTQETHLINLNALTHLENKQARRNQRIFDKSHSLALTLIASVGTLLLLTPFMPIGAAILVGVSVYGIMHTMGYNPFGLLGKGLNWLSEKMTGSSLINLDPYAQKTNKQIHAELVKAKKNNPSPKAEPAAIPKPAEIAEVVPQVLAPSTVTLIQSVLTAFTINMASSKKPFPQIQACPAINVNPTSRKASLASESVGPLPFFAPQKVSNTAPAAAPKKTVWYPRQLC